MNQRKYPVCTVTPKGERAARGGHPWVYGQEITGIEGSYQNGDLVDVCSAKGRYLGTGMINDFSKIRVRLISRNANDRFDEAFWLRRLSYAVAYRHTVMESEADFSCCRLIFGEADQFPGLTVDRFGDVLVTQTLCLGTEQRKKVLFPLLLQVLQEYGVSIRCIYERNDVAIRKLEGMEEYKGFYALPGLDCDTDGITEITENGIHYLVDYINGQKTGFFLDQKYNRRAAAGLANGRVVLDCFTHTGSFAMNCAKAGAKSVCAVDISQDAIEMTKKNAARNGLANMTFQTANVFDLLSELYRSGKSEYDYIILDPPAFTKSAGTKDNAYRGYKEINLKAMKLLPRGGYLATCSCSHFMPDKLFCKMLCEAAADAGVTLRQIEARQQAADHPILFGVSETDYLKFYLFQVV